MSEPIRGLTLTLTGQEIIDMAKERAENCRERLTKLETALGRVEEMAPEDREIAGLKTRGGDMAKEVSERITEVTDHLRFFEYMATHTEADSSYRLSPNELKLFGFNPPRTY